MKFFTYFNSVKMLKGIFRLLLAIGLSWLTVYLFNISNDAIVLKIFYSLLLVFCAVLSLLYAFDDIKNSIIETKKYTKQERYERDLLLIARVKSGKVQ